MPRDRPPHHLLLAHDFPPMGGGMARWMGAVARYYPAGQLTVSTGLVAEAASSDAAMAQRIDRIATPVSRLRTIPGVDAWRRRAVRLASGNNASFAWCDTVRPAGYVGRWVHQVTRIPYGILLVGNDVMTLQAKLARGSVKRPLIRTTLNRASVIVAISEWTARRYRQLLDELELEERAASVQVVALGTDPDRWCSDRVAAEAFRKRRNLPVGPWLLTVARLVPYKGVDTGIEVVAALQHQFPGLQYGVVGDGPDADRLRRVAEDAGVADRVHLLQDIADDELAAVYSLADVYLGLTRETALDVEGFGLSLVEAAACGVPVVAARSGGIPDAVRDGVTGLLVTPDDVAEAASAVAALLGDPERRATMGGAGRMEVERYWNWDRVVGQMRDIAAQRSHDVGTVESP